MLDCGIHIKKYYQEMSFEIRNDKCFDCAV